MAAISNGLTPARNPFFGSAACGAGAAGVAGATGGAAAGCENRGAGAAFACCCFGTGTPTAGADAAGGACIMRVNSPGPAGAAGAAGVGCAGAAGARNIAVAPSPPPESACGLTGPAACERGPWATALESAGASVPPPANKLATSFKPTLLELRLGAPLMDPLWNEGLLMDGP